MYAVVTMLTTVFIAIGFAWFMRSLAKSEENHAGRKRRAPAPEETQPSSRE